MKNTFLFSFLLIATYLINISTSFAQKTGQEKIDSLFAILKTERKDTAEVSTFNVLANEFRNSKPDTAIYFANKAIEVATKLNYKIGIAEGKLCLGTPETNLGKYPEAIKNINDALNLFDLLFQATESKEKTTFKTRLLLPKAKCYALLGNAYYAQGNFSEALNSYAASLEIGNELGNKEVISDSYNSIGIVNGSYGNYPEALKDHFAALKINEEMGNKNGAAMNLGNIGTVYEKQGNYSEALKNYFSCLKIQEEIGNKRFTAACYNNIGKVYKNQGNYPEALKNYLSALKINEEMGNKNWVAINFNNIGNIFMEQGNFSEALRNFFASLKLREEIGDKSGIAGSNNSIGDLYARKKMYNKASEYFNKSLEIAKEIGNLSIIQNAYIHLYELDSAQGKYKLETMHYKLYIAYRDSLFSNENSKKILQTQMQYEFDKKVAATKAAQDKKDALANAEIKRQTLIRNSTFGGVGIVGIFSFFLIRAVNRRRKTAFEKQVSEVEMTALRSQMNPHFIFNSLHSINNYLMNNDKKNASDYLGKFSKLMRLILENSREQDVPLEKDLLTLELYLELEAMRFENKFTYKIEVADDIDPENTLVPPMILQPFVENSILHGMQHKESEGKILIKVGKENNMINCIVEDNGVGRQKAMELKEKTSTHKGESLGMKITNARIDIINKIKRAKASVNLVDLSEGMRVEVKLPHELAF